MTMMTTTIESDRRDGDAVAVAGVTPASVPRHEVNGAPPCRCGRPAQPYVDDVDRRMSSHRTAAGHVVYYRCECGRPRFAHVRWTDS